MLDLKNIEENYISPNLINKANKDLLIIAFPVTDAKSISTFKKLWSKYDLPNKAVGRPNRNTKKIESDIVGGCITLIDPNIDSNAEAEVLAQINIKTPRGLFFCPNKKELLVGSAFDVKRVKYGEILGTLKNNLFNGIHSIKPSENGIYVVSSSTDSIVEIDPTNQKVLWDWIGTEAGYQLTEHGEIRKIARNIDYSKVGDIGTSHHTTHVNGVQQFDVNHVLATLFHQDILIKINKKTKRHKVVLRNLINPHGIHKFGEGFIVSDTRGNRVLLLDRNLDVSKVLEDDFDWVQDAIQFDDWLIVLNENKARLDIYSQEFELVKQISWDTNHRMSNCIYKIAAVDAKAVFLN